ncbi:monovalent cation/H+ antiporter complex subunit F [Halocalculus aciditolerans]|uniref:Multicomponent Na+:H+ antiporter subunit F n=1 Tax=Halocalculus aciditolerans TaxID=1383812 RepID=A0A830FHT8_9EURY|nr:monovalent cation/H+ antiporter complex subunit F [Halocalculus aciditolerans]GGL56615.1 hypothetical protein GCM10009039_13450 [Halocalculus aciditolerans]
MSETTLLQTVFHTAVAGTTVLASALTLLCTYRILAGPTVPDRTVALDTVATNVVAIGLLHSLNTDRGFFVLVALVLATVGFITTVVVAKFLGEGAIVE